MVFSNYIALSLIIQGGQKPISSPYLRQILTDSQKQFNLHWHILWKICNKVITVAYTEYTVTP